MNWHLYDFYPGLSYKYKKVMKNKLCIVFSLGLCLFFFNGFKPLDDLKAELVLDAKAMLGEGAIWHPKEKKLYWVDIEGKKLHVYDPSSSKDKEFLIGSRVGTVVPVKGGGALVALQTGIHKIDTKTGKLQFINNPLPDTINLRFNDGKCDPSGRFWVGTLAMDSRRKGAVLYRMDGDKSIRVILDSVSISNGIVWTADKTTMYYNDTPTGTIQGFDYDDKTGKISNRRVVVQIGRGAGGPDGMTIDADGNLWVALWGSGTVAGTTDSTCADSAAPAPIFA